MDGSWCAAELLIDTGADLTVLSANVLETLDWKGHAAERSIGGIGGTAECVAVTTQLRFTRADFVQVVFRGAYLACADPRALDMSVLGRDILEMFAVIVDYSGDTVCLLGGRHRYSITNP